MATGFVFHELYLWHNTGLWPLAFPSGLSVQPGEHAESPEPKRRFKNLLDVSGASEKLVQLKPRPVTEDELLRVHPVRHIDHVRALSAGAGGDAGELTPIGGGGFEIAKLAAGGVIVALDAIIDGTVANAYALVRPPGHHALPNLANGFCIFSNIGIAIRHAQAVHGLQRIAVIDWDVHHGNGTQGIFYEENSVLAVSIHQDKLYSSNSGSIDERGSQAGLGSTINIPLPPGSGIGAYAFAFDRVIVPALERYRPELIVVACGLDAAGVDPLGRMLLSSDDYRALTRYAMDLADRYCRGKLLMVHEGGYSAMYAPYCGLAVIETLGNFRTEIVDPMADDINNWAGRELQPHQAAVIDAVVESISQLPVPSSSEMAPVS